MSDDTAIACFGIFQLRDGTREQAADAEPQPWLFGLDLEGGDWRPSRHVSNEYAAAPGSIETDHQHLDQVLKATSPALLLT